MDLIFLDFTRSVHYPNSHFVLCSRFLSVFITKLKQVSNKFCSYNNITVISVSSVAIYGNSCYGGLLRRELCDEGVEARVPWLVLTFVTG